MGLCVKELCQSRQVVLVEVFVLESLNGLLNRLFGHIFSCDVLFFFLV